MMTVKEVARALGVSLATAYNLVHGGKIPAVRVGLGRGTIRVREEDLEAFVAASRITPPVSPAEELWKSLRL
jgi:excisionase family DNA binding protein